MKTEYNIMYNASDKMMNGRKYNIDQCLIMSQQNYIINSK